MSRDLVLVSHRLCPYVQRAVIVLEEKGIAYRRVDIDLAAKPDWFLAVSPTGKTPLLLVDGVPIFESAVIVEYLDETVAPALLPADPLARARHRAWVEFASGTLSTIAALYAAADPAGFQVQEATLRQRFQALEAALAERDWFDGPHFGIVDAAFAPVFRYFEVLDPVLDPAFWADRPKLVAWRQALARRPSVIAAAAADYPTALRQFLIGRRTEVSRRLDDAPHQA